MASDTALIGFPTAVIPLNASLTVFPPEILGEITSYLRLNSVIRLLLIGNQNLTERLSSPSGVRVADLYSRAMYREPSLPPLIRQLKGIKLLHLDFSSLVIDQGTDYTGLVSMIPSGVSALYLHFSWCFWLWRHLQSEKIEFLGNLQTLVIDAVLDKPWPLEHLPPSLTSLKIPTAVGLISFSYSEGRNWLPPALEHLTLLDGCSKNGRDHRDALPSLNLQYFSGRANLKTLDVRECQFVIFDPETLSLPSLTCLYFEDVVEYEICTESGPHVTHSSRDNFNLFCRRLPPCLKSFEFSKIFAPSPSDLSCWSSLRQWTFNDFPTNEIVFPPNVTDLWLPEECPPTDLINALSHIPRTVQTLDLGVAVATDELLSKLPQSLVHLCIAFPDSSLPSVSCIPPSLTILEVNDINPDSKLAIEIVKMIVPSSPALCIVGFQGSQSSFYRVPSFAAHGIPSGSAVLELPNGAKWVNFDIVISHDALDAFVYLHSDDCGFAQYLDMLESRMKMIRKGARRCLNYLAGIENLREKLPPKSSMSLLCAVLAKYFEIEEDEIDRRLQSTQPWNLPPIPESSEKTAELLADVRCILHIAAPLPYTVHLFASTAMSLKSLPLLEAIKSASSTPCRSSTKVLDVPDLLCQSILAQNYEFARWCMAEGEVSLDFHNILEGSFTSGSSSFMSFISSIDPECKLLGFPAHVLHKGDHLNSLLKRRWLVPLVEWLQSRHDLDISANVTELAQGCLVYFSDQPTKNRPPSYEAPGETHSLSPSGSNIRHMGGNDFKVVPIFGIAFGPYHASEICDLFLWFEHHGLDWSTVAYGPSRHNMAHFAAQTLNLPLLSALLALPERKGSRMDFQAKSESGRTPQMLLLTACRLHTESQGTKSKISAIRSRLASPAAETGLKQGYVASETDTTDQAVLQLWREKVLPTLPDFELLQAEIEEALKPSLGIVQPKDNPEEDETPPPRMIRPPRRFANSAATPGPTAAHNTPSTPNSGTSTAFGTGTTFGSGAKFGSSSSSPKSFGKK